MIKTALFTLALISGINYGVNLLPYTIVTHVHDGDTFTVERFVFGKFIKKYNVRIADCDTKELKQPGQDGLDADKARVVLMKRLVGQNVNLTGCIWDAYRNRDTCDVYHRGQNIASWLVSTGWAFDAFQYSKGRYSKEERHAKRFKRGIWAKQRDGGVRPWDYRHALRAK